MKKRKIKVALGLSGGVDSAVSAYLLKKQGFDVFCVYLNCYDSDTPGCRGDNDRKDALAVAMHLGLPFQVLDFRKEYQAAVIDYFKKEYLLGRTPNPDVVCNRDIKFGLFLDWAVKNGYDAVATGHYAKIVRKTRNTQRAGISECRNIREPEAIGLSDSPNFRFSGTPSFLSVPEDLHKDQTYFLWAVPGEKFKRVLFPLGNLLKTEVREIALKIGLPVAKKKDSTGICFVGEVRVEDFLKRLGVKEKKGEVVIKIRNPKSEIRNNAQNSNVQNIKQKDVLNLGNSDLEFVSNFDIRDSNLIDNYAVIGRHKGVWFYTIGQRHGFEITNWPPVFSSLRGASRRATWQSSEAIRDKPVFYVIEKDIKKNRLIVGFGAETYRDKFIVGDCNWQVPIYDLPARRRYASGVVGGRFMNYESVLVRIRHCGELIPCQIKMIGDHSLKIENCPPASAQPALLRKALLAGMLKALRAGKLKIKLGAAQRGVAPGQSAVFYDKNGIVLGGGVIQNSHFVNKPILE